MPSSDDPDGKFTLTKNPEDRAVLTVREAMRGPNEFYSFFDEDQDRVLRHNCHVIKLHDAQRSDPSRDCFMKDASWELTRVQEPEGACMLSSVNYPEHKMGIETSESSYIVQQLHATMPWIIAEEGELIKAAR
eukprot:CAMPEP_0175807780 /NCGR_PEP_ID=MMETSP0107_2-20121207/1905_1 /TAXON_ID=195067 ORGANISM="Goniomonas pacifica, Strain CCMP1869" /NCGR_SAMPLE_ID=MMETSP0107_2 /ASSEMBLY_ACC=CAM_ASM_000203 /LENGTH=132 /DNA_ID=CAMNT_0017119357 /DNA_START=20 /DNA_END=418 /DNA_ORIENTATION=-